MAKSYETPIGVSLDWPRINGDPNTKYDDGGMWECKVRFDAKEGSKIESNIMALYDEELDKQTKANKGNAPKQANKPWTVDDDGSYVFKFKNKATITPKNGSPFSFVPPCFDSTGNRIPKRVKVFGGTELKVKYEPYVFNNAMLGFGVSLRLKGTCIWKLVSEESMKFEGGGGYQADSNYDAGGGEELTAHATNASEGIEEGF